LTCPVACVLQQGNGNSKVVRNGRKRKDDLSGTVSSSRRLLGHERFTGTDKMILIGRVRIVGG